MHLIMSLTLFDEIANTNFFTMSGSICSPVAYIICSLALSFLSKTCFSRSDEMMIPDDSFTYAHGSCSLLDHNFVFKALNKNPKKLKYHTNLSL